MPTGAVYGLDAADYVNVAIDTNAGMPITLRFPGAIGIIGGLMRLVHARNHERHFAKGGDSLVISVSRSDHLRPLDRFRP
jgi:hypothetical protein